MKLLLTTSGTRGDFQPLLALAIAARGAGHEVLFVSRASFAPSALDAGVPFESLRDDGRTGPGKLPRGLSDIRNMAGALWPTLVSDFATLVPLAAHYDVLIGIGNCLAIPPIAKAFQRPFATICFFPSVMESSEYPPRHVVDQRSSPAENLRSWREYKRAMTETVSPLLERLCVSHGLPALDGFVYAPEHSACTIIACEPRIAPLPADVRGCVQTGFLYLEQPTILAAEITRFLAAGDPPIYVSFGSVMPDNVPALRALLSNALRRVGCRAIVSGGLADGPGVLGIGDVDHQGLFPHTAGVVHHGGSGTVAAAARAGVPQLVVPFVNDQFYWGHRIHTVGLGPEAIPIGELTEESLVEQMTTLVSDGQARGRARVLSEQIEPARGVEQTLAAIERLG